MRGFLIALVLLFLGSLGIHAITNRGDNSSIKKECAASNATDQLDCRNVLYINSIQDYRQKWFRTGHDSGDPKSCNTFGNAI